MKKIISLFLMMICINVLSRINAAEHFMTCNGKQILGSIEKIKLLNDHLTLDAKLDTGAAMSSLTAQNIKLFKRQQQTWVQFDLYLSNLKQKVTLSKPLKGYVLIRKRKDELPNSNALIGQRRMIIPLEFV